MSNPYLGEIRSFSGNFAPLNWHICDGSLLNIADYNALYSLLGTNFGGNGTTTFALPDLRGRLPIGSGQGTAQGATSHPFASSGGFESVTLTTAQVPAHSHAFSAATSGATTNSPSGAIFANPAPYLYYATNSASYPLVPLSADTIAASGGGNQMHENRMPAMAISYIICVVNGIYPQRP